MIGFLLFMGALLGPWLFLGLLLVVAGCLLWRRK